MNQDLCWHESRWHRAVTATDILALALERDASHLALAAAQEAARSALLVLAGAPSRLANADRDVLRQMAAASPQHLAGRPAERQAGICSALAILDRLFPRPPTCEARTLPAPAGGGSSEEPGDATLALGSGNCRIKSAPACWPPIREAAPA